MPNNTFAHFVFVDMENIGEVDLAPLAELPVNVTLLVGKKQMTLSAKLVEQITQLPFEVRLVKVGATRKNALDFSLVFHLGQMAGRHPGARFHIVSRDKRDFDMIVAHMQAHQVQVCRVDSIAALSFLPRLKSAAPVKVAVVVDPPPVVKKPVVDRLTLLIESFKKSSAHRPKKRATLLHHISAFYGNTLSDAEQAEKVAALEKQSVISFDGKDRVSYAAAR